MKYGISLLVTCFILGLFTELIMPGQWVWCQTTQPSQQVVTDVQTLFTDYQTNLQTLTSTQNQLLAYQNPPPVIYTAFVDGATGSDTNSGLATKPFKTISRALKTTGAEVWVRPGTYQEALSFLSGTHVTAIPGTVIINGNNAISTLASGGANVVVKGLRFTGSNNVAVLPGNGWKMVRCEMDHNAYAGCKIVGLSTAALPTVSANLEGCHIHDNGVEGLGGGYCAGNINDCEIDHNNTTKADQGNEAGGGKFTQTNGLTFNRDWYHDNDGVGLWFDFKNQNFAVNDCWSSNNIDSSNRGNGIGFMVEVSQGPGTFTRTSGSGDTGTNILIAESENVTLTNCYNLHSYVRNISSRPPNLHNITYVGCTGLLPQADPITNVVIK